MTTPAESSPAIPAHLWSSSDPTAEAGYRLLFERSPAPMWVFDRETLRFLAVNDAALQQYGWSRDEFLGGMTILDIRPTDDVPFVIARLAARRPGLSEPVTWRHVTREGALRYASITSSDIVFGDRPARLVLALDVTDAELARLVLARSQAQLAEAQQVARMGSWEWDLSTDAVHCSDELLRLAGHAPRRTPLSLAAFIALAHAEDRAALDEALRRTRAGERMAEHAYRMAHDEGERRLTMRAELISTDEGHPLRVVGTAQDETGRQLS